MLEIVTKDAWFLTVKYNDVVLSTNRTGENCCRKVFLFDDFVVKFEGG